jgi:8-oxo-dGTP pyrophosphatase MutT (NUDIX family)
MVCCNCGGVGHLYRQCNHPITSYGCIAFRLIFDPAMNCVYPEYLMVQRKDSLAYVEFIRGKYSLQNVGYISNLLSNMTGEEHSKLLNNSFEDLWKELWSHNNKVFAKEYSNARDKFNVLSEGYKLRDLQGQIKRVRLSTLVEELPSCLQETEWGFPKGRRNFHEDDKRCALREFREETGINLAQIRLLREFKPLEEIFSGSNHMRYKHVYYIAKYVANDTNGNATGNRPTSSSSLYDPANKHQVREIKDVQWFCYQSAQAKINDANIERKELLKRVNSLIVKNNVNFA